MRQNSAMTLLAIALICPSNQSEIATDILTISVAKRKEDEMEPKELYNELFHGITYLLPFDSFDPMSPAGTLHTLQEAINERDQLRSILGEIVAHFGCGNIGYDTELDALIKTAREAVNSH
jgi:hypothetical protein